MSLLRAPKNFSEELGLILRDLSLFVAVKVETAVFLVVIIYVLVGGTVVS